MPPDAMLARGIKVKNTKLISSYILTINESFPQCNITNLIVLVIQTISSFTVILYTSTNYSL